MSAITDTTSSQTTVVKSFGGKETAISINKETTYYAVMEAYAKLAGVPIEEQRVIVSNLIPSPSKDFAYSFDPPAKDCDFKANWYYKNGCIELLQIDGKMTEIATKKLPRTAVLSDKVLSANNWSIDLKLVR